MGDHPWTLTDVEVLEGQPALGKGAYGIVYIAWWKGTEVAAKRVHETLTATTKGVDGVTNAAVKGIEDESDTMQRLRHPHLVQFLGVYYDDLKRLHIVMEKLQESLADLLERSGGPIFETTIYSIGTDITSALRYMHELPTPIAHRDLTPKNVLLTVDLRAKVSDLGACKYALKLHAPMTATLAPGNPKYMPPEALDGGRYAKYVPTAVDVFSLAIVLLEMFSGTDPEPSTFSTFVQCPTDPSKFNRVPEEERRSACFKKIPKDHSLTKLILTCVAADHTQRPAMREIQDTLLSLQGKHVPRARSKPIQSAMHASHREKTHRPVNGDINIYDDVSGGDHHYENVTSTNARVKIPPPPLPRNPSRSAVDKHIAQKERRMSGTPQNAANGQPFRVVTPPAYEPLHFELGAGRQKGSEGTYDKGNYEQAYKDEMYEELPVDSGNCEETYEEYDSASYLAMTCQGTAYDQSLPQTQRKRSETGPNIGAQEKFRSNGRAPRTVYESKKVTCGPDAPPLPSKPPKTHSKPTTEESHVYDSVEEVETVLKVTEPLRKKQSKSAIVQKNGHKLPALNATQNELLVTIGRMSNQSEMVHARNSEGKSGVIADAQVQLVKPVTFHHSSTGSPGILQHITCSKAGPRPKSIHISSSKIAKGNLETLTSLANTDVVAVEKPSNGGNAYFEIDLLKQRLVRLEGYLLQWTRVIGRFGYPLQWMIEVSLDGTTWKMVGMEQQNATTKTSQYWAVRKKTLGRYLRISLLGTNSEENYMLCLSGIELYGELYSSLDNQYAYI